MTPLDLAIVVAALGWLAFLVALAFGLLQHQARRDAEANCELWQSYATGRRSAFPIEARPAS